MSALGVGAEDVSVVKGVEDVSDEDEAVSEDVVSDREDASVEDVSDERPELLVPVISPDSKFTSVAIAPPCIGGEPTSPIPPPTMEMITNRRRKGSPKMMSGPLGGGTSNATKEKEHSPLSLSM